MKSNLKLLIMPDGTKYYKQEDVAGALNVLFAGWGWVKANAFGNNGNVIVRIAGNADLVRGAVRKMIESNLSGLLVGDGNKTGEIIIDGYEAGLYGDTAMIGIFNENGFFRKKMSNNE